MERDLFLVEIPITRNNYETTEAAKFEADLFIITNKHGIIYDWKINFKSAYVDLMVTDAWYYNRSHRSIFNNREKLFKLLDFKQRPRKQLTEHDIRKVEKIEVLNDYFNDRTKYDSTLNNIIAVLKGSSPSGKIKNPTAAEMIIDISRLSKENLAETYIINFVRLLDDLTINIKLDKFNEEEGDSKSIFRNYEKIAMRLPFRKYINITNEDFIYEDIIKKSFIDMQKSRDKQEFNKYLKNIKEYKRKYDETYKEAIYEAEKARSQFALEIKKNVHDLPFELDWTKDNKIIRRCHIYEYHKLKNRLIIAYYNYRHLNSFKDEKVIEDCIYQIKDHNNFIPLKPTEHTYFDNHYFTYDEKGYIKPLTNEGIEYVNKEISGNFKEISKDFLNEDRQKYLKRRNIYVKSLLTKKQSISKVT